MAHSWTKHQAPVNRLRASLPKIGIRPAIDGRYGGVRESLEDQVMGMARATAEFLTKNVRHACGQAVECVIADTCIGGVSEAARCAEKFARAGVGVSLTVTPCWCYGAETMDMDPLIPKAVWGFNGTERPGAVYLAAVLSGHAQKGLPAFGIYGHDVQDMGDTSIPADVQEKLIRFAQAGIAVATMRGASYLAIGGTSMGIAGSIVNNPFFEQSLGMRVESIDMTEVYRRIRDQIYDRQEFEIALEWVKANAKEGQDPNSPDRQLSPQQKDEAWEFSVKMALIARDLMNGNPRLAEMGYPEESEGHNALAAGFQGQRQWTDTFPNGDFLEAILCSSFDWNGIRQPYIMATENDSLNGATMLLGHLLTGTAQMFSDVRTFWSADAVKRVTGYSLVVPAAEGVLHLINSGASALDWTGQQCEDGKPVLKRFQDITPEEAAACVENTRWCPANLGYFRGGGYSSEFLTRGGMPVTMARLNLVSGLGATLQIAEGYTVDLPEEVGRKLMDRTDPTWPTTWFAPRLTGAGAFTDVYTVMNNWGANHGAISFGHIGADLITLASMLRIPVDMHNVEEEKVFRPAVWSRFGTSDIAGADFRACANFGPLYR
ncbi:MAG: L-fucose isomerase [Armatimonadetes bacterium]|nr:L-fucose isomerase [Armatimonadota bacterium]